MKIKDKIADMDTTNHTHGLTQFKISQRLQHIQWDRQGSLDFSCAIKFIKVNFLYYLYKLI